MKGGGAERQLTYLCNGLTSKGLDVHVALCNGGSNMERLDNCGAIIHKLSGRGNHDVRILLQLVKLIKQIKPDLIQTWLRQMDVFGSLASIITSVPAVISERSSAMAYNHNWKHFLRALMGKRAAAIISNSENGKWYWEQRTPHRVQKRVIRNIIPFEEIGRACCANLKIDLEPTTKLVIAVARFKRLKNLCTLLEAFEIVMRKSQDVAALLFGEGPLRGELTKVQERIGLGSRLGIMGFTSDLYTWLRRADVFVSVSHFEGNPNTVLEAIACKCPVVVSDIPSHREILNDSSAFFVDPSSKGDIAKGLALALSQEAQVKCKVAAAYENVSGHSPAAITQQYIEAYEEIVRSR